VHLEPIELVVVVEDIDLEVRIEIVEVEEPTKLVVVIVVVLVDLVVDFSLKFSFCVEHLHKNRLIRFEYIFCKVSQLHRQNVLYD